METLKALKYALGIYGLSVLVTLFVWLVIVGIRRVSRDRSDAGATTPNDAK